MRREREMGYYFVLRDPFDRTWGTKQSNHRAVKLTASMVQSGLGLNLSLCLNILDILDMFIITYITLVFI